MVSSRQKGNAWEKEAEEMFRHMGYTTWKPGRKAVFLPGGRVFSQSQDILECADIIGVMTGARVLFVQVTGYNTGDIAERKTKMDSVDFDPIHTDLYVVGRKKGVKEFVVWYKSGTNWTRKQNRRKVGDEWEIVQTIDDD